MVALTRSAVAGKSADCAGIGSIRRPVHRPFTVASELINQNRQSSRAMTGAAPMVVAAGTTRPGAAGCPGWSLAMNRTQLACCAVLTCLAGDRGLGVTLPPGTGGSSVGAEAVFAMFGDAFGPSLGRDAIERRYVTSMVRDRDMLPRPAGFVVVRGSVGGAVPPAEAGASGPRGAFVFVPAVCTICAMRPHVSEPPGPGLHPVGGVLWVLLLFSLWPSTVERRYRRRPPLCWRRPGRHLLILTRFGPGLVPQRNWSRIHPEAGAPSRNNG